MDSLPVITLILLVMLIFPSPSKIVGIILVLSFIVFCYYTIRNKLSVGKLKKKEPEDMIHKIILPIEIYKNVFLIIVGLIGLLLSSNFAVKSSSNIALIMGIPKLVIGATLIAIGTSLPEIATTWEAVKESHKDLAIGNIVGSCMTNITLILGIVIIFSPLNINITVFSELIAFVLLATILLWSFLGSWGRRKIDRKEGIIFLILYALFVW